MQYAELPEVKLLVSGNWLLAQVSVEFHYLHIVFPDDDTLSDRGTTIVNGKKSPAGIPSISLSTSLYITLLSSSRS